MTIPVRVSFEFFPPKEVQGDNSFWSTVRKLEGIDPLFVSVTYGAGGTTQDRTLATLKRLSSETHLKPAGHLTCVGKTKTEVNDAIRAYAEAGVQHIVSTLEPQLHSAVDSQAASLPDAVGGLLVRSVGGLVDQAQRSLTGVNALWLGDWRF